jgi:hypothetical protein
MGGEMSDSGQSHAKFLRELRRQFPAEAGFTIEEALRIELVEDEQVICPVTIVEGNELYLEFRPKEKRSLGDKLHLLPGDDPDDPTFLSPKRSPQA